MKRELNHPQTILTEDVDDWHDDLVRLASDVCSSDSTWDTYLEGDQVTAYDLGARANDRPV